MANIGYSAPNNMVAIICERIDNKDNSYRVNPKGVAFGRIEGDIFYPEDNSGALPSIEDIKALQNEENELFYIFPRDVEELQQIYAEANTSMVAAFFYTDIKNKVILAENVNGNIEVKFANKKTFKSELDLAGSKSELTEEEPKKEQQEILLPSFITNPNYNAQQDLSQIDNFAMEQYLKERIFKNDDILEDICTTIAMNYMATNPKEVEAILSVGPTGSGKTETFRLIAEYLGVPLTIYDSNSITSEGYVGKSIEDVIRTVYVNAGRDTAKAEKSILVFDEIDKLASRGNDVKDEAVQNAMLKVLDGYKYHVPMEKNGGRTVAIDTSFMTIAGLGAFPAIFDKKRKSVEKPLGFGVVDTTKKEADMLSVTTDELVEFGMLAELMGRFHNKFVYAELKEDDLRRILIESKGSPLTIRLNKYLKMFNATVEYDDAFIEALVAEAVLRKAGGRSLDQLITYTFKKADRALIKETKDKGMIPKTLKLTPETVKDNKRFTM